MRHLGFAPFLLLLLNGSISPTFGQHHVEVEAISPKALRGAWTDLNVADSAQGRAAKVVAAAPDGWLYVGGRNHAWVARVDAAGDAERFHVLLTGSTSDSVDAIAVDGQGRAHVGGTVWRNGKALGFYAVVDASGNRTSYTELISPVRALAVNGAGDPILGGDDFVTVPEGWIIAPPGPVRALAIGAEGRIFVAGIKDEDAYLARLEMVDSRPQWTNRLTLGGTGRDEARSLVIGRDGVIYAAGTTTSEDFPVRDAWQSRILGHQDAWLAAISGNGAEIQWATYLGGRGWTEATALLQDANGNLEMAGHTDARDLLFDTAVSGGGFVARFSAAGRLLDGVMAGLRISDRPMRSMTRVGNRLYAAGTVNEGSEQVVVLSAQLGERAGSRAMTSTLHSRIVSPSLTLSLPGSTATYGAAVTLQATASPSGTTGLTGAKVTFYAGSEVLGIARMSAGGVASLTTRSIRAGAQKIRAYLRGDGVNFTAATSAAQTLTVTPVGNTNYSLAGGGPYQSGGLIGAVATADFNSDGKADIAAAMSDFGQVAILLGNGDGTFTPAAGSPFTVGAYPMYMVTGDFNEDGFVDLAVVNQAGGTVNILLNDGTGQMIQAAGSPVAVGGSPRVIVAADLNKDGTIDLVVANQSDPFLTIMFGNGDGTFSLTTFGALASPGSLAVGDFDNDGDLDIAVADNQNDTVYIFSGNGAGGFVQSNTASTQNGPTRIRAFDYNNDGKIDLLVSNWDDHSVSLLTGNGAGGFVTTRTYALTGTLSSDDFEIGDFNGDGVADWITTFSQFYLAQKLGIAGSANYNAGTAITSSSDVFYSIATADFNGDGTQDFVIGSSTLHRTLGGVTVYLAGNGSKLVFTTQPPSAVTAGTAFSAAVTAENAAGNLVQGFALPVTIGSSTVTASNGVATFNSLTLTTAGTQTLTATASGLADGVSDPVTVTPGALTTVVFTTPPSNTTVGAPISPPVVVELRDAYGNVVDTSVSVTISSSPGGVSGTLGVAAVHGVATFSNLSISNAGTFTLTATASGKLATSPTFTVARVPTKLAFSTQPPSSRTAGVSFSTLVRVLDAGGALVSDSTAPVTIDSTTVNAVGGVATFSLTYYTAGTYTLTAKSPGLTDATSTAITINASTSTKLVYAVPPSNGSVGQALSPSIVVKFYDQYDNQTGAGSQVTLTSTPAGAGGTLSGFATAGAITFSNVVFNTAGDYTLKAASGVLTAAVSDTFTIASAPASKLAFSTQPPSSVTAGAPFTAAIQVQDSVGNLITSSTAAVTIGSTTVNAVAGVATFNALSYTTAGSYMLTATSPSLTSATSGSFNVTAAAASQLVFTTQPSNTTAGVAISPAPVVKIQDQYGNTVNSTSAVTIGSKTVNAVAGVASFTGLIYNVAGNYTLTATTPGLTSAISNSFTVNPGAANKLAFSTQPPSSVTAGAPFGAVVQVQDSVGNLITGSTAAVTIGSTTVNAVAGVATFSSLVFNTAGSYTLSATSPGLLSATSTSILVTAATASKLAFTTQPSNTTAGAVMSPAVVVKVEDQYGNVVDSTAAVTIGSTTVNAVAGVATFSGISYTTPGSYTLTATSPGLTSATSSSFTITAAAATQLVFTTQPPNGTAGQALAPAPVVKIQDQYGNVVGSTAAVTIGSTTVTAVAGVATFPSLVFNTAGNYTLTATSPGLTSATSNQFTISAGSGNKLAFSTQPPASATAGQTFSAVVQVQDTNGNVVGGSTAAVTIGSTTVNAVAGVATFSSLSFTTAGNYTLTATSPGLANATSTSIAITAAAASQLVFTTQPQSGTAGQALTPAPVVKIQDQYGNVVSSTAVVTIGSTTVTAVAGVATFPSLVFNTAGNYTLTATSPGLTSATSNQFTISAGSGNKLAFTTQPPASATAGQMFTAVVQVQDTNGNVVSGSTAAVTIGSTTVNAVAGEATFSLLSFTTAGNYTLTATSPGLANATSTSITITAAAPASASIVSGNSQSAMINTPFAAALVVKITDAFNNPVNNASVTFTPPGSGASANLSSTTTTTNSSGQASVTATANGTTGTYSVTVAAGAATTSFTLTNTYGAATVLSVSSITANGTYTTGANITLAVDFSTPVTVTGTPQLVLNSGGTAIYLSGSGTSRLLFAYAVGAGQNSTDLDYTSTSALVLNGGAITNGAAVTLTLPAPGAAGSLGANANLVIDTTAPTVTKVEVLFGNASYPVTGSQRNRLPWLVTGVRVTFSEPIATAAAGSLTGVNPTQVTGIGTNVLTFPVAQLANGSYTLTLAASGAAAIRDAAGNALAGGQGYSQAMKILSGDYNDDGVVNASDQTLVNLARGKAYDILADIDGNGVVDATDVQLVRQRIGTQLP